MTGPPRCGGLPDREGPGGCTLLRSGCDGSCRGVVRPAMAETGTDETVCYRKATARSTPTAAATKPRLAMPRPRLNLDLLPGPITHRHRFRLLEAHAPRRRSPFACVPRINATDANRARRIRRCSDCRDRDNRPESSVHSGKKVNPLQKSIPQDVSSPAKPDRIDHPRTPNLA